MMSASRGDRLAIVLSCLSAIADAQVFFDRRAIAMTRHCPRPLSCGLGASGKPDRQGRKTNGLVLHSRLESILR
ncbi:MAG: hypothetical protein HC910_03140 [Spirulinaceae cyanobacterium SM2_1_0]|nr:hypothetical protein [Spirulinaceae cyanobacterium SM2_1_0]